MSPPLILITPWLRPNICIPLSPLLTRAGGRPKALQAAAAAPVIRVPVLEAPAVLGGPQRRRLGQEQRRSQEEA